MRFLTSLIGLCLTVAALAQERTFAGTKSDIVKSSTAVSAPGMGLLPFFQMLIALGIVFALVKFALPKVLTKMNKGLKTSGDGIKIEESASFAGGNLYVVAARGKSLLLSVSTSGVTCLADLSEPKTTESTPLPTFLEILETAQAEPEPIKRPVTEPALLAAEISQPASHVVEATVDDSMLLEDVHKLLEAVRSKAESEEAPEQAVVEQEVFKTRLPENTVPLKPIVPEPQPWQPRRLTDSDRSEEIEAVLRRIQQLSS